MRRFGLALEIDALAPVEPIDLDVSSEEDAASLKTILRGGGIDVSLMFDELQLPFDPSSGALDRADLYQLVSAWRNRSSSKGEDASLYALFTTGLIADNGEALFGMMFDTAGREGFAVAPRTTARYFEGNEPGSVQILQLRTFTHELLHALNRHHSDAAQMADGRLTLEAPTRCISNTQERAWTLRERPLMALSPATIQFFQTAEPRDVLPGPNNSPYVDARATATATECDDARANRAMPAESRWHLALRRIRALFSIRSASAQDSDVAELPRVPAATIGVYAQSASYPLGYPIAVRVVVENSGSEPLSIVGRLNPSYGMLVVEHRAVGESEWTALEPMILFEPTSDEKSLLAPGARTEETIPVYFGDQGWAFPHPGEYQLRARLQSGNSSLDVASEPIEVSVQAPSAEDDRDALQPLLDADGRLSNEIGRLLSFGGRIGKPEEIERIERVTERYGHTALGSALKLTLLSQRLRRPIDPQTGRRPPPDFGDALEFLEDVCTDSGIAVMASDLLERGGEALPASIRNRAVSDSIAWDGMSPDQADVHTYGDTKVRSWGPSIHFCFDESQMRGSVRRAMPKLVRRLQHDRPARVIVVGHSDQTGSCRYNNALALRRAQAVRNELIASGLKRTPIEIVSLGQRRPADFAANTAAQDMNRRVEILVEGVVSNSNSGGRQQLMPSCPARPLERSPASSPKF